MISEDFVGSSKQMKTLSIDSIVVFFDFRATFRSRNEYIMLQVYLAQIVIEDDRVSL